MAGMRDLRGAIGAVTFLIALVVSGGLGVTVVAQDDSPQETPAAVDAAAPEGLRSPLETYETFVNAMRAGDIDAASEAMNLSAVSRDNVRDTATRLWLCIRAIDEFAWDFGGRQLPTAEDLAADPRSTYRYFPRPVTHDQILRRVDPEGEIVLARQDDGRWLFSEETCQNAAALFDNLRPIVNEALAGEEELTLTFSLWLERQLPASLTVKKVLGLKYWQWLGAFLLILLGVSLDYMVRGVLSAGARAWLRRKGGEASKKTLRKTVRPFGLFVAALFWLFTLGLLGLPNAAFIILSPAVKFFAMLASVWAAYRLTDLLSEVFASRASATHTKVDDLLVPLVRKTVKIFIAVMGVIYIADSFEIEILPLLTGLGIGSLAFAFAAKDTIENFFGSIAVIADRPFEVGDWVKIDDVEGIVEELGFRSTRVRTFYNSLMTVPNATLVRATVDNFGRRKYRRWTTHINITYDTPPEKIEAFCEGIREIIRLHPYTRKDYYQVWLHRFGPHSLDVLLYVFHDAPDWQTELRERHRLMLDIIRLAGQLGIEFAFPTQTLHVFREEHEDGEPAEPIEGDPTGRAMRDGRLAVRRITEHAEWRREKPGPYRFTHASATSSGSGEDDDTQIESRVGGDA